MKAFLHISFAFLLIVALAWGLCLFLSTPAAAQKTIPNVVGMTLSQAQNALAQTGVTSITSSPQRTNDKSRDQRVYAQAPGPGEPIAGTVVLGYYQFQVVIPNVVGMTLSQAQNALAQAGVTSITYSQRPTVDRSLDQKVFGQTPSPGQLIAGTVVLEYYRFQGIMPNVVGLTLNQAKDALIQTGVLGDMITINPLTVNTPSLDQKVFGQTPRPGEPIFGTVLLDYYRSNR